MAILTEPYQRGSGVPGNLWMVCLEFGIYEGLFGVYEGVFGIWEGAHIWYLFIQFCSKTRLKESGEPVRARGPLGKWYFRLSNSLPVVDFHVFHSMLENEIYVVGVGSHNTNSGEMLFSQ